MLQDFYNKNHSIVQCVTPDTGTEQKENHPMRNMHGVGENLIW